ncbi:MAG: peptide deformylase [Spirochaetes bacterium]|nr:peptide deformylase [Spirochaetota bacterium]
MSYKLVYYGSDILKNVADDVKNIDQNIIDLIDTMFNIMYKERGIGLAGPQANAGKKIITIDIENFGGQRIALINPEIISKSEETEPYEEGCLSFPGISEDIIRPSKVAVKGITPDGKEISFGADGLYARVLQHEIDHINGVVFIDHLEDHIRREYRKELKKIKKLNKD